jgi:DNA-binding IclR family transcriptional regulator
VRDRNSRPVAGISVAVPLARMAPDRWEVLAKAVQRICRAAAQTLP